MTIIMLFFSSLNKVEKKSIPMVVFYKFIMTLFTSSAIIDLFIIYVVSISLVMIVMTSIMIFLHLQIFLNIKALLNNAQFIAKLETIYY